LSDDVAPRLSHVEAKIEALEGTVLHAVRELSLIRSELVKVALVAGGASLPSPNLEQEEGGR
jgi:hypothetical protein